MFDKNLFFALCEKYNVEISSSAKQPMIRDRNGVHAITDEDIGRIFDTCQTFFVYSGKKIDTNIVTKAYYLQEDFASAC